MDIRYQVKQYVAKVRNSQGGAFCVFKTGDDRFYLFQQLDPRGFATSQQFPVLKKRLRDDIRRALANGWGNA